MKLKNFSKPDKAMLRNCFQGIVKNTFFFISFLVLTSFRPDLKVPWIKTSGNQVILFSRPSKYTGTESPDTGTIRKIIQEQEDIIRLINKKLGTDFRDMVKLYLFNFDEAKEKIGTNRGG